MLLSIRGLQDPKRKPSPKCIISPTNEFSTLPDLIFYYLQPYRPNNVHATKYHNFVSEKLNTVLCFPGTRGIFQSF